MVKATSNLSQIAAAMTLARYYARQAIKAEWHKRGVRWQCLDAKDIAQAAEA